MSDSVALAIRLAVRSRMVARLNELDRVLMACGPKDGDISVALEFERDQLIKQLRG
jgi:hypothetical protein